jgi:hypothetical protein
LVHFFLFWYHVPRKIWQTCCSIQGDQIGRIFAQWVIVYFGQLLENYRSIPHVSGYFIPWISLGIHFDKKTGWATFWAIFSQTHLVTLVSYVRKYEWRQLLALTLWQFLAKYFFR